MINQIFQEVFLKYIPRFVLIYPFYWKDLGALKHQIAFLFVFLKLFLNENM